MSEYEDVSPQTKTAWMAAINNRAPYWSLLGMKLVDIKKGWSQVSIPFDQKLTNPTGLAHGGAIFSSADSAVALALMGLLDSYEDVATAEIKLNYFKPFASGEITASAAIIHKTTNLAVGDVEVRNSDGVLLAKGLSTYSILKGKPRKWQLGG